MFLCHLNENPCTKLVFLTLQIAIPLPDDVFVRPPCRALKCTASGTTPCPRAVERSSWAAYEPASGPFKRASQAFSKDLSSRTRLHPPHNKKHMDNKIRPYISSMFSNCLSFSLYSPRSPSQKFKRIQTLIEIYRIATGHCVQNTLHDI